MENHQIPVPTQVKHSWRATVRTIFQAAVGLCALLPLVFALNDRGDLSAGPVTGAIAVALAACGLVTRIMAAPAVNAWIEEYVPWLAAQPTDPQVPELMPEKAAPDEASSE